MENRLVTEQEFRFYELPIPEDIGVVAFKLVNLGPNTLKEAEFMGTKICEIAAKQPSFFIITDSSEELRKTMHDFVDRFCNAREGKTE